MLVESQEQWGKYRGMNPAFVEKIRRKRREEQQRKLKEESVKLAARKTIPPERLAFLESRADIERMKAEARRNARIQGLKREAADAILAAAIHEADKILEKARAELDQIYEVKVNHTSFTRIAKRICKVFGYSMDEITSSGRTRRLVFARQAICYWAARRSNLSLERIGVRLSRDHSTVLHSRDKYPKKPAEKGRYLRPLA